MPSLHAVRLLIRLLKRGTLLRTRTLTSSNVRLRCTSWPPPREFFEAMNLERKANADAFSGRVQELS